MALVLNTRKDAARDPFDLSIRLRWRPGHGRRVRPLPADTTEGSPSTLGDRGVGQIPPVAGRKSDHGHDTARSDQVCKPDEPLLGIQVMQRGDRDHSVKGTTLERNGEHIPVQPLDCPVSMTRPRPVQRTRVEIETNDGGHPSRRQLGRQDAIATSHIQNSLRSTWDCREKQRVVLDVGIPEPLESHAKPDPQPVPRSSFFVLRSSF